MPKGTCSTGGCELVSVTRGLCATHYEHWRDVHAVKRCAVKGCDRGHRARGYCALHYDRVRKHGDPLWETPPRPQRVLPIEYEGAFRCRKCGAVQPHTAFAKRPGRKSRQTSCDSCRAKWAFERNLLNWYGITLDDYSQMLAEQGGRCALCKRKPPVRRQRSRHTGEPFANLHVDHDHGTGRVRGLLCGSCNQVLERVDAVGIAVIDAYLGGQLSLSFSGLPGKSHNGITSQLHES